MLITNDSYAITKKLHKIIKAKAYTITSNELTNTLELLGVNGVVYKAGPIESINELSNHIKSKEEWAKLHPEFFI